MKLILAASLLAFISNSEKLQAQSNKNKADILVKIENIKSKNGTLKIALVNKESGLSKNDLKEAVKTDSISVTALKMTYTIKSIPYGIYSIMVFHDENDNDSLDTDLFDVPTEGFGYSNNPKAKLKRPTFKESSFKLNQRLKTIVVTLKHL